MLNRQSHNPTCDKCSEGKEKEAMTEQEDGLRQWTFKTCPLGKKVSARQGEGRVRYEGVPCVQGLRWGKLARVWGLAGSEERRQ